MELTILYTTWPDRAAAMTAAKALVGERLAACCNLLGAIESVYRWDGQVQCAPEFAMLVKTTSQRADAAKARILALHSYEIPAIIAISPDAVSSCDSFLQWVARETDPQAS
jgi:periplasmic divalent cation tolerance protein